MLKVEPDVIQFCDLEQPIATGRQFDLAISLEVAEHLSLDRSPGLVSDLCTLSDLVLFSAAIPSQGGTGHINERWQSQWAELFNDQEYATVDAIRPRIWNIDSIPWWYRQNILLYVKRDSFVEEKLLSIVPQADSLIDIVHPELFALAEHSQPWRALKRGAKRLLRR